SPPRPCAIVTGRPSRAPMRDAAACATMPPITSGYSTSSTTATAPASHSLGRRRSKPANALTEPPDFADTGATRWSSYQHPALGEARSCAPPPGSCRARQKGRCWREARCDRDMSTSATTGATGKGASAGNDAPPERDEMGEVLHLYRVGA